MKVNDKDYYKGQDCEFRADGKLRGGKIIREVRDDYFIVFHAPKYREITLSRDKVKIL